MPCILKIHVEGARGLPAMDRTSDLVDAYVEIRFGDLEMQRTTVCRKTNAPTWREDFRFEVSDDTLLQDEPLEFKVFDFDAIRADDSVGTVSINLNPLLAGEGASHLAGWFPIYDTIRGARGELWVQAKLEFFEDSNPFKDSTAGIHLFTNGGIPLPYSGAHVIGLVDVVITEVDPDYHWTDSFRTSRSSNEASQRILHQMSCRLRRQMTRKAAEMGGNAILAYNQHIDIESYAQTITFRGLGTAAIVHEEAPAPDGVQIAPPLAVARARASSEALAVGRGAHEQLEVGSSAVRGTAGAYGRAMEPSAEAAMGGGAHRLVLASRRVELLTLSKVPPGSLLAMGGVVSSKSVKLMSDEVEYGAASTRDRWLADLREDICAHARQWGCNAVLGYRESISISDSMYVLCAEGTACRLRRTSSNRKAFLPGAAASGAAAAAAGGAMGGADSSASLQACSMDGSQEANSSADESGALDEDDQMAKRLSPSGGASFAARFAGVAGGRKSSRRVRDCAPLHMPKRYALRSRGQAARSGDAICNCCSRAPVSTVLLATIEVPEGVETFGEGHLVESFVFRPLRRRKEGESPAVTVSANLPFVEYEIYRQLHFKARYHGFNGIFGLKYHVICNDRAIIAIASGTGTCLAALPEAHPLKFKRNTAIRDREDEEIYSFQESVAHLSLQKQTEMHNFYTARFAWGDSTDSSTSSKTDSSTDNSDSGTSSTEGSASSSSSESQSSSDSSSDASVGGRRSIVQIDDEADEDLLLTIAEPTGQSAVLAGNLDRQAKLQVTKSPHSTLRESIHYVCLFRRFALDLESRHPNSALSVQFQQQYDDLMVQVRDVFHDRPQIHCIRHQVNLVRGVELQIVTTASVFGLVSAPVPPPRALLGGGGDVGEEEEFGPNSAPLLGRGRGLSDDDDDDDDDDRGGYGDDEGSIRRSPSEPPSEANLDDGGPLPHVAFSNGSLIPNSVFGESRGSISLQLFKEIYYHESSGGFSGFVSATIQDLFAMVRASASSLGGNALTSIAFKPAAFYENFKNQLHAVLQLSGDVIRVDYDHPDAWTLLQERT